MAKISKPIQCTTRKTSIRLGEMAHHARQGNGIHKWVNDKVPGAAEVVLTDATLYYDIPEGKVVFIRKAWGILTTVSDCFRMALVGCTEVAGGGAAEPYTNEPSGAVIYPGLFRETSRVLPTC